MKAELVCQMQRARSRVPRERRHYQHDPFLDSPRPSQIAAEHGRSHDAKQVNEVDQTTDFQAPPRLDLFDQMSMGGFFFPQKEIFVEHIEHNQENNHSHQPLWHQAEGPEKRNSAQESK